MINTEQTRLNKVYFGIFQGWVFLKRSKIMNYVKIIWKIFEFDILLNVWFIITATLDYLFRRNSILAKITGNSEKFSPTETVDFEQWIKWN